MTNTEKLNSLQILVEHDASLTNELGLELLNQAADAIIQRMHPIKYPENPIVPAKYERLQIRLAQRYFLQMGGEGETAHSENGISRTYDSANNQDLLLEVMQVIE